MEQPQSLSWHSLDTEEVCNRLHTTESGLSDAEAAARLAQYGPNRLRPAPGRSLARRFLGQFHNVLIYVLLVAAGVTVLLGHWVDAGVIVGVVLINALIGFIQEGRAEQALDAIRHLLGQQACVRRNGRQMMVAAQELAPGDLVLLQPGDKVPADLRLLRARNLRIDEAVLTGESLAVDKDSLPVAPDAALGDHSGMAYSGTLVTYGQGSGVVVAIGDATELGRISNLLAQVETLTTPLLQALDRFGRGLSGAIVAIAALTLAFGVLIRGYSVADMFLAAVSLAVAAIPEGLPAIMTITMAIGVQRMARRNAIIRRLPAVETLGAVTVICSDKTGTLTRNEMTVCSVATAAGLFGVTGSGYGPHGGFVLDDAEIAPVDHPLLAELARAAVLCNDASLQAAEGQWTLQGDPTEGALLALGLKAGLDLRFELEARPRTDVIPFDAEHRFMATLHHDHLGQGCLYVKGAPERIFAMCATQRIGDGNQPFAPAFWTEQVQRLAGMGQRVLAIADKASATGQTELRFADVEQGLTLLGLVGIMDPPREEAIEAVRRCQSAGIRVKMITGDHAVTATAIAARMGIGDGRQALLGHDLEALDDQRLRALADQVDVFARASPEHKLRLVTALQANGQVVAMTGDGVNDAPALKRADVGVAMGRNGTDVAKEAASVVLADDNFASIAHAVEEGRTVYDNIRKAILYILPTSIGEALIIVAAILAGLPLPITPVQILWINLVTEVTLSLSLAFEPPEQAVMARPPRNPREPLLTRLLVWRVVFMSLLMVAGTFGLFLWEETRGAPLEYARTVAVDALVLIEVFYLFSARYISAPALNRVGLLGNRYVLLAVGILLVFQGGFTYLPVMQLLFGTQGLGGDSWVAIILVAASALILVELEKALARTFGKAGVAG